MELGHAHQAIHTHHLPCQHPVPGGGSGTGCAGAAGEDSAGGACALLEDAGERQQQLHGLLRGCVKVDSWGAGSHSSSSAFSSEPIDCAVPADWLADGGPAMDAQRQQPQPQLHQQAPGLARAQSCTSGDLYPQALADPRPQQGLPSPQPRPPGACGPWHLAGPGGGQQPGTLATCASDDSALVQQQQLALRGPSSSSQWSSHTAAHLQPPQPLAPPHGGGGSGGGGGGSSSPSTSPALAPAAGSGEAAAPAGPASCAAASASPQLSSHSHAAPDSPGAAAQAASGGDGDATQGSEGAGADGPRLPVVNLKVSCGDMVGTLMVHKAKIVINEGTQDEKEVSPTEFERLGGRSATKKWKQSIRLVNDDGELGRPVGEWYLQQGLEPPKKPRDAKDHLGILDSRNIIEPSSPLGERGRHASRQAAAAAVAAVTAAAAMSFGKLRTPRAATRHASGAGRAAPSGSPVVAAPAPQQGGSGAGQHSPHRAAPQAAAAAASAGAGAWAAPRTGSGLLLVPPVGADAGAAALDAAALGDWQLPPNLSSCGLGACGAPQLLPMPVGPQMPGDTSQAVVEMLAYLEGRRATPPWRLLPANHRPVIGRLLVPLRELFVLVLRAGGYLRSKDDLLAWQEMAAHLQLPAWPAPEVPDPLRALQGVYRDYLLRFEGRFALGAADAAAAPAAAPLQQPQAPGPAAHCAPLAPPHPQLQQPFGQSAIGGAPPVLSRSPSVGAPGATLPADSLRNGLAVIPTPMGQQQQQQPLPEPLPPLLDDLSGDLMDLLTDLASQDNDAAVLGGAAQRRDGNDLQQSPAAQQQQQQQKQTQQQQQQRQQRQHPEMAALQQRQRLQQMQQMMLSHSAAGVPAGGHTKRPPPLVRCGDSDVISLMDQSEVARLLHEYEQQQQYASMQVHLRRQQQQAGTPLQQQQQQQLCAPAGGSALAAAVTGAVDRNMSEDLHALMQSYWQQREADGLERQRLLHPQQQAQPAQPGQLVPQPGQLVPQPLQQQQQQQQQQEEPTLQQQEADEQMSGMLEALQLAGGELAHADDGGQPGVPPHGGAPPAAGEDLLPGASVARSSSAGWGAQLLPAAGPAGRQLLGQGSVGVHLVADVLPASAAAMHAPASRPPPAPGGHQQQQQQPAAGGDAPLPAPPGGLLRFSSPSTGLIGAALDSPTARQHQDAAAWMDVSAQALTGLLSADLHSMTVELTGPGADPGADPDDLAAVMQMW